MIANAEADRAVSPRERRPDDSRVVTTRASTMPRPTALLTFAALTAAALLLAPWAPGADAEADAEPAGAVSPPRTIVNPFHPRPVWKLWAEDPSPVVLRIDGEERTFAPPPEEERLYPVFPEDGSVAVPALRSRAQIGKLPREAGTWDDCYISLDGGHSRLRGRRGQMVVGPDLPHARLPGPRLRLGANFTSQSYARRGRHIVDDSRNNLEIESLFFFANCVRATPAHASFDDNDPEKAHDDYDGLFGHAFQSVGQSGSEVHALWKMMLAGGCLPRTTKDLLKRHGAYAIVLMTLFKIALPYADATGEDVPYEHELRHRVAYSAHGDVGHPHWCSANAHYHGYDDDLHLARMCDLARRLSKAPPVALLRCRDLSVEKDGKSIVDRVRSDDRIQTVSLTSARIWGREGETLALRIDLAASYDLQGRALSFVCRPLLASQGNVEVEDEGAGRFTIRARHDPALPKGRIPVICVARAGGEVPSNPVFVNFYWPEANERSDHLHFDPRRAPAELRRRIESEGTVRRPVTVNLRPRVELGLAGDALRCQPGQTVSFRVAASDPEGHPVSVYRRSGEPGRIRGDMFRLEIPDGGGSRVERLHFLFSDGTGGVTGRRVKLLVSSGADRVPEGWRVTTVGSPRSAAEVSFDLEACRLRGGSGGASGRGVDGTFLYRELPAGEDLDIQCEIPSVASAASVPSGGEGPALGLMVRGGLEDFDRQACVLGRGGTAETLVRPREARWGARRRGADAALRTDPRHLRLTRREGRVSLYLSGDARTWELVASEELDLDRVLAGVIQAGGGTEEEGRPAPGTRCRWVRPTSPLPSLEIRAKPGPSGSYRLPVELAPLAAGDGAIVRHTLDGSEPDASSPPFAEPVRLETAGRHELRMAAFHGGERREVVVVVVEATSG